MSKYLQGTSKYPPKFGVIITRSNKPNAKRWIVIGFSICKEHTNPSQLIIKYKRFDKSGNKYMGSLHTKFHKFYYVVDEMGNYMRADKQLMAL